MRQAKFDEDWISMDDSFRLGRHLRLGPEIDDRSNTSGLCSMTTGLPVGSSLGWMTSQLTRLATGRAAATNGYSLPCPAPRVPRRLPCWPPLPPAAGPPAPAAPPSCCACPPPTRPRPRFTFAPPPPSTTRPPSAAPGRRRRVRRRRYAAAGAHAVGACILGPDVPATRIGRGPARPARAAVGGPRRAPGRAS